MKTFPLGKPLLLVSVLLVPALLTLACGSDNESAESTPTKQATAAEEGELFVDPKAPVVEVALGEFFVRPGQDTAAAGAVTFEATNQGKVEHELVIIKTDTAADQFPVTDNRIDEATVGQNIGEIESEHLAAGAKAATTFDLEAGKYVLICDIPGHYEAGMHVAFTVK